MNLDEMRVLPGEGNGGPRDITRESQNWRAAVFGRLGTTMDTATRIDQHTRDQLAYLKKQMKHLRAEVKLYMFVRRVPKETTVTRRGTVVEAGVAPTTKPATLSDRPKLLSQLWNEWIKGIDGRLPAKEFTAQQRGEQKIKHLFCHRKPFWLCVERLIDNGFTSAEAVSKIDDLYKGSVTNKLKELKKHEKKGGHYQLCPRGRGVGRPSDDQ